MSDLGNKEILAKNLQYYMSINKKDRNDLSRDLDLPYTTITSWCKGDFYPRIDKIQLLANYFNIQKADLVENKEKVDKFGNPVVSIPILGTVKAGYDYMAQENWEGMIDVSKNIIKEGSEYFALKIKGDSMNPNLIEDDIVIVRKQDDFETGDLVVAIVNGDESTIKKGRKNDNSIVLQPFNPSYEPLVFTYDEMKTIPVTILGVVKKLEREF